MAANEAGLDSRSPSRPPTRFLGNLGPAGQPAAGALPLPGVPVVGELDTAGYEMATSVYSYVWPGNWPTYVTHLIEWVSATGELTWAGGILCSTVLIRVLTAPLMVKMTKNAVKLHNILPQTLPIQNEMQRCKEVGDADGQQQAMKNLQKLWADNDCSPFKAFQALLVQMPTFICFFLATRKIAETNLDSVKHGGWACMRSVELVQRHHGVGFSSHLSVPSFSSLM